MSYEFSVTAFDASSSTNSSISCIMQSSGPLDNIADVIIQGEATTTGYIDFSREQTAFKAFITNMGLVKKSNLTYKWVIRDSSGNVMQPNQVTIYQNSIGILTSLLNRNSLYYVFVAVTDGTYWGNATQILQTKPDISNEFNVGASDLNHQALVTLYTLSVYSQRTFETLDQYVFGYIDPSDGMTQIPMTSKTYKKFVSFILPNPGSGGNTITCYVNVIMPNRVSMTYYKTAMVLPTSLTVAQFLSGVSTTVMDDIIESLQMRNKLVSLQSQMSTAQQALVIQRILLGMQAESTPLSNYYIQSSVGSLL